MNNEQLSDDALIAKALLIDEARFVGLNDIYRRSMPKEATIELKRFAVLAALTIIQRHNEEHGLDDE